MPPTVLPMSRPPRTTRRRWLAPAVAALLVLVPSTAALAASGGPDDDGYSFVDSSETGGPTAGFTDISATGTDIGNHCDDCRTPLDLPFPVTLYGQTTSSVVVSSNGYLQVASTLTENVFGGNNPMPAASLATALAPYWNDLRTDGVGDGIFTQVSGSPGSRQLIMQWETVVFGTEVPVQAEIVLHEGSSALEFRYGAVAEGGASAAVGIQQGAAVGLGYSYQQPTLSSGLAIAFTQAPITSTIALAPAPEATIYGEPGVVTATVTSAGDATGTPTGTVQFFVDGAVLGAPVPLDETGTARLQTGSIPAGTPLVTARYSGDDSHSTRAASTRLTIRQAPVIPRLLLDRGATIAYGDRVAVRINVPAPSEAVLPDAARPYVVVDGGFAGYVTNFVHESGVVPHTALKVGTHSVRICSVSTPNFLTSCQAKRTVVVTRAAARMAVTSSASTSASGDPVTFTAAVNPRPVTGTVTWTVDGVQQGSPVVVHGGTATLTVPLSGSGDHTVVATWSGDLNVADGSASLTQTVS